MIKLTLHNEDATKTGKVVWINPDQIIWMVPEDWKYNVAVPGQSAPVEMCDRVTSIRLTHESKARVIETPDQINNAAYFSRANA